MVAAATASAQTTAMDFSKNDCNGVSRHLFADLDSGKAVVLFYFMPSCGSCPPPAQKIQTMANHINAAHPGMVKAYAFPFNNTTLCSYTQSWVTSNSLPLYAPMDSGATAVAYYGGFGMPTVVLVGGNTHRVMFSTLSFSTGDTLTMRDSILALIGGTPSGINSVSNSVEAVNVFPNPAINQATISLSLIQPGDVAIELIDVMGNKVTVVSDEKNVSGNRSYTFQTDKIATGCYIARISVNGEILNKRIDVLH